ncbi:MAG: hypothetical protein R6U10_05940 [Thermoplasmatota archaeon]
MRPSGLAACLLTGIILAGSLGTTAVPGEHGHGQPAGEGYIVYEKTLLLCGISIWRDSFTTPQNCTNLSVQAEWSPYFTGSATIYIESKGHGRHTIWGTGIKILGHHVYPQLRYFNPDWFYSGEQNVELRGSGFGVVTFTVMGHSS